MPILRAEVVLSRKPASSAQTIRIGYSARSRSVTPGARTDLHTTALIIAVERLFSSSDA